MRTEQLMVVEVANVVAFSQSQQQLLHRGSSRAFGGPGACDDDDAKRTINRCYIIYHPHKSWVTTTSEDSR